MNKKFIPWIAIVVLLIVSGGLYTLYNNAKREQRIAKSNEKVALDTTRISLVGQLQAASRLIEQKDIKVNDLQGALARALRDRKSDARVVTGYLVTINKLHRLLQTSSSESTDAAGVRTATFTQQGPPIEGTQIVTAPPPPKSILLESHLGVTPFQIRYGLGCDNEHTPVATFETPTWVQTTFQKGQVDPTICNPKSPGFFSFNFSPNLSNLLYAAAGGVAVFIIRR